jgi:hypothetical protein
MIFLLLYSSAFAEQCQDIAHPMAVRPLVTNQFGQLVPGPDLGGALMHYFNGNIPWGSGVTVAIPDLYPANMGEYADESQGPVYGTTTTSYGTTLGNVLIDDTDNNHVIACTCPTEMDCNSGGCQYQAEISLGVVLTCAGECWPADSSSGGEGPTNDDPTTPQNTDDDTVDVGTPLDTDWCSTTSCQEECNDVNSGNYNEWINKVYKGHF